MSVRLLGTLLLSITAGAVLAAAPSEPIANYADLPVKAGAQTRSAAQVREAIIRAGTKRNWMIADGEPGQLVGVLFVRGKHRAEVTIGYSSQHYSVAYRNSENLNYDGEMIHPAYNRWVKDLIFNIEATLVAMDRDPARVTSPPPVTRQSPPRAAGDAIEVSFWESVRDTKSPAELQAYLDKYPQGVFATLARARLAALRKSSP